MDKQFTISYLPLFEQDLAAARDYIAFKLKNPRAGLLKIPSKPFRNVLAIHLGLSSTIRSEIESNLITESTLVAYAATTSKTTSC